MGRPLLTNPMDYIFLFGGNPMDYKYKKLDGIPGIEQSPFANFCPTQTSTLSFESTIHYFSLSDTTTGICAKFPPFLSFFQPSSGSLLPLYQKNFTFQFSRYPSTWRVSPYYFFWWTQTHRNTYSGTSHSFWYNHGQDLQSILKKLT